MAEQGTKLWYLEQVDILKGLNMEEMMRVAERTRMSGAIRNQRIYFPDEPSDTIYFLKQGKIKIATTNEEGKEMVRAVLFPGEVFGEMAIIGEGMRRDQAIALDDDVIVCSMSLRDAQDMMMRDTRLQLAFTRVIGERSIALQRRLENLVFKDSRSRILELLRTMAHEHGRRIGHEVLLDHSLTHQDIADLSATARQTVSTLLSELEKKNVLHQERGRFLFRDLSALN